MVDCRRGMLVAGQRRYFILLEFDHEYGQKSIISFNQIVIIYTKNTCKSNYILLTLFYLGNAHKKR